MIFERGLPRDSGATDFADSARLAGLMVVFGHPGMDPALIAEYVINGNQGTRFPYEDPTGNKSSNNPKSFTRDQLMCLSAGLAKAGRQDICLKLLEAAKTRNCRAQNTEADVPGSTKKFPDGADLLTPSHMNQLRICSGAKPTITGKALLILDICFNGLFTPMSEPNQLICMCVMAGPKYVKLLRKMNKRLDAAIREYWSGWRGEPELAELIIKGFQ
jgi:hypothetical protein